jgi:hypothetical protein
MNLEEALRILQAELDEMFPYLELDEFKGINKRRAKE